MNEAITLLLGLCAGACGYFIVTFWMNPILRYLQVRHDVTSDLVFYANVFHEKLLNAELQERAKERRIANREHASEIVACYYRLPFWYKWLLQWRMESPLDASKALIGLSNSTNDSYQCHEALLRKALNLMDEP